MRTTKHKKVSRTSANVTETWRPPARISRPWFRVLHLGRHKRLPKGAHLYRQGEPDRAFYLVISGRLRVSMLYKDGHEFILEYMGRGAITGEGAAFDGQPRFSAAVAMEPTEVVRFEAPVVLAAFPTNPELASSLLEVAALKQRILAKRAQTLSTHHPTRRIAEVLLRLAQTYGRPTARGLLIDTRLTHTTLAAMTGTSRVTVTRTLRRLAQSGTIELVSRAIRVCCLDELHRLASS